MRGDDDATAAEIVGDPDWFVEDYDPQRAVLSFVRAGRDVLGAQPFLDYRWNRKALKRRELSLDAIAAHMSEETPLPRLHFIWHTSFCCSTLLAEALDLPAGNLSLREPLVLVAVADAKRAGRWLNRPMPPRLIEIVFRLLGRSRGETLTVKPSNFANVLIDDAASLTQGKALLLYSDLEDFLVSIEKGGEPLRKYARRLLGNIAGDGGATMPPPQDVFQMSDLEVAALAWHMQIAHLRRAAALLGPERAASLDSAAFLADPKAALSAVDAFFDLGLGETHISRVLTGPLMKRHAKEPSHPFDADQRRAQADAMRRRLGPHLQRISEWSHSRFPDTRQGPLLLGTRAVFPAD